MTCLAQPPAACAEAPVRRHKAAVRRGVITAVSIVAMTLGVTGAIGSTGRTDPGSSRAVALEIIYTQPTGFGQETYSLACDPASGSMPNPRAVCSAISRNPGMVLSGPGRDHSCPPEAYVHVRGTFRRRHVDVTFSYCLARQGDYTSRWLALLPTTAQEDRVRLDRGLGPLHLGEAASAVHALLGRANTKSSGIDVYPLGRSGFVTTVPIVFGVGYGHGGRIVTLISNSVGLTIYGHGVAALTDAFHGYLKPSANSPLRHWAKITCEGTKALADHSLHGKTTMILMSPDHPSVIVSSAPKTACATAATAIAAASRHDGVVKGHIFGCAGDPFADRGGCYTQSGTVRLIDSHGRRVASAATHGGAVRVFKKKHWRYECRSRGCGRFVLHAPAGHYTVVLSKGSDCAPPSVDVRTGTEAVVDIQVGCDMY